MFIIENLHGATDGLFEVAVGRELVAGGFLPGRGIGRLAAFTGDSSDITLVDETPVRLGRRTLIDLGGIATGHAVDRAVDLMIAAGVPAGCVNAGGDMKLFGNRDWRVGLRDADGHVRRQATVRNAAIAISANLLQRRRRRGRMHTPHIGRGRQPVLAEGAMSVLAESCAVADAMTKVALADLKLARRLVHQRGGRVIREPERRAVSNADKRTARLARWQIWMLCLSGTLLWLSGSAWLLLHYYGQV